MSATPLLPPRGSSSATAAWKIPPFPYPLPERRIGVVPTEQGLLVYPLSTSKTHHHHHHQHHHSHTPHHAKASTTAAASTATSRPFGSGDGFKVATIGTSSASSLSSSTAPLAAAGALPSISSLGVGFLIDWNREAKITPLPPSTWKAILDSSRTDSPSIECFGIIGLSRFFSSSYLFVITNTKLIGHYFHETRPIYCCTGTIAIPLLQDEATQAIRAQLSQQNSASTGFESITEAAQSTRDDEAAETSSSNSDSDSSESDFDDVETPAAIPKEPFFSSISSPSQQSNTLRMPKSRPWLTRAARSVSDGRIETISEDPVAQSQLADVSQASADSLNVSQYQNVPQPPQVIEAKSDSQVPLTASDTADAQWHAAKQAELEDKAVRETAKYWARGEFWFSYDFDLTTSLQNKKRALQNSSESRPSRGQPPPSQSAPSSRVSQAASTTSTITNDEKALSSEATKPQDFPLLDEPYANLPLWRRADRRFWHNEHMSKDLIHAGLHAYILPVMQGYLQTVSLPVEAIDEPKQETESSSDFKRLADAVLRCQMMVISRRSKERAGLRYQRRGINESGQVANFVETEQILYVLRSQSASNLPSTLIGDVLSFVQIRGSIPLYWSQSPFSLKPPPVLERSDAENIAACRKHFSVQVERYGSITCVNLAEQGGKEGQISKAYRTSVEKLRSEDPSEGSSVEKAEKEWDRKKLHYVDFDFHKECSGMKFENVAKLLGQMHETLAEMKYYHHRIVDADKAEGKGSGTGVEVLSRQTGVFRVSCLDCLDRTNVVQSAFARHVLTHQLATLGMNVGSPAPSEAAARA